MKQNLPVTENELVLTDRHRVVSTTNLKGQITYANEDFIQLAGFNWDELDNKAHNIVRHPDMPPAAFQNLWDILKTGKPWMGIVKNRCKNGDNYWVDAYVTPMYEGDEVVGYQSVRVKPKAEFKQRAGSLYQKLNAGKKAHSWLAGVGACGKYFLSMSAFTLLMMTASVLFGGMNLFAAGGITLLGLAGAFGLAKLLTANLRRAAEASRSYSDNPVANLVYAGGLDEVSQLRTALIMQEAKLRTVIGRIGDTTEHLDSMASNTAATAEQTLCGAHQQQGELDQAASAIHEMAATVQEVARNTSVTADSTVLAQEEAKHGRDVINTASSSIQLLAKEVSSASDTIQSLHDQTQQIGAVLDVIRNIAEQTNLLALNAAIEAARAGEHGRGFAVVADEVRGLATRTQESTGEIHQIIEKLQSDAESAVNAMNKGRSTASDSANKAQEAVTSLNTISKHIDTISDMATQIATAAEEQSAVAEEINRNTANISNVADQTSSAAQRSVDDAQQLRQLVEELNAMTKQFGDRG